MSAIKDKFSLKVEELFPGFIRGDDAGVIDFLEKYYEFMESAELVLDKIGLVDKVVLEEGSNNYILLQNENVRTITGRPDDRVIFESSGLGAFQNNEILLGKTSGAKATIRAEDINNNSRLFISTQNKFLIGEEVEGQTSLAHGVITSYRANPVENITQLMDYADVDETIDSFFSQFKHSFMRTIPNLLTTSVNKRTLLKNVTDLYRAKGTRKGHELFFKVLLNEDVQLFYPTENIWKASDGKWSYDTILRVSQGNDTVLMESNSDTAIFVLHEDGSSIMAEDSIPSTDNSTNIVGQTIAQGSIFDPTILEGGAYYDKGYLDIDEASAVVETITKFTIGGEIITELVLNKDTIKGQFVAGQQVTCVDNTNPDKTLSFKIISVLTGTDIKTSGQYFELDDPIAITSNNGSNAAAKIESLTSGKVAEILVDAGGTGYKVGDLVGVNNANAGGVGLSARVSAVDGGVQVEVGSLKGWHLTLEDGSGKCIMEEDGAIIEVNLEEDYECLEDDHIVYENWTTYADTYAGNKILQESGVGDITDVQLINAGLGYYKLPILTFDPTKVTDLTVAISSSATSIVLDSIDTFHPNRKTSGKIKIDDEIIFYTGIDVKTLTGCTRGYDSSLAAAHQLDADVLLYPTLGTSANLLAKGDNVGKISQLEMLNSGVHYHKDTFKGTVDAVFLPLTNFLCTEVVGAFIIDETITGGTSGATAIHAETQAGTNIQKVKNVVGIFVSDETITGTTSGATAIINSYGLTSILGRTGASASSAGERLGLGSAVTTFGKYVNQDGFISDSGMKIQDSYYYQDYSYVIRTASSIVEWRENVLNAVHPAGFAMFGEISRSTLLNAQIRTVSTHPSVIPLRDTFTPDLLSVLEIVFTYKIGRRLGTSTQGTLNSNPAGVIFGNETFNGDRDVTFHTGPGHMELVLPTYTGAIQVNDVTSWWQVLPLLLANAEIKIPVPLGSEKTIKFGTIRIDYDPKVHSLYEIDMGTSHMIATSAPAIVSVAVPVYEFVITPHLNSEITITPIRTISFGKRIARRLGTSDDTANATPNVATNLNVVPTGVRDVLIKLLFRTYKETRKSLLDSYAGHGVMIENLITYKDLIRRGAPGMITLEDGLGSIQNETATGLGNIRADALEAFRGHIGYTETREWTTLNEGSTMSATDVTITLTDASTFPSSGTIKLEDEKITYASKSGNDLTGCIRGVDGTTATTHADGKTVYLYRFIQSVHNASGYRIQDWGSVTLDRVINYPESRGNVSAPSEISIELTA